MQSKYEVIGIVGEGAYGIVYKCRNKENGEFVAIKKFKETEDDIVKKTMSRELRALQSLKHDNIVEYKEAFKRKGNLYLVFEYVEKNLLEILQENPKGLDPNLIKNLIYQLCYVIKYLHGLNVVHRDIKPENLLIDSKYKLKLCDFGFARNIKVNKESLTDYVATRWYRAPELLTGEGIYGTEVDFWAIGCIMGELVDGDPLFPGENELDQVKVIQKVIGKLTDEQNELIIKKNAKLKTTNFDIIKPETLERRYMGKLPKLAISFMKSLLNPDPKQRLRADNVLQHPYFEEFANLNDLNSNEQITINKDQNNNKISGGVQKQITQPKKHQEESKEKNIISVRDDNKENKENKKTQPIINQTTNINIINYNNFNDNKDKDKTEKMVDSETPKASNLVKSINMQEDKAIEKKLNNNKKEDLGLTSTSFNKNYQKDNVLSIMANQNIDGNFKTFYNGEKYNYNIDLKAIHNHKSISPDDKEDRKINNNNNNIQNKNQNYGNISNISNVNIIKENTKSEFYSEKAGTKLKKKGYENKFTTNNVIKEESYQSKPPKYDYSKVGNNKTIYNVQLPTIGTKGYHHKKK